MEWIAVNGDGQCNSCSDFDDNNNNNIIMKGFHANPTLLSAADCASGNILSLSDPESHQKDIASFRLLKDPYYNLDSVTFQPKALNISQSDVFWHSTTDNGYRVYSAKDGTPSFTTRCDGRLSEELGTPFSAENECPRVQKDSTILSSSGCGIDRSASSSDIVRDGGKTDNDVATESHQRRKRPSDEHDHDTSRVSAEGTESVMRITSLRKRGGHSLSAFSSPHRTAVARFACSSVSSELDGLDGGLGDVDALSPICRNETSRPSFFFIDDEGCHEIPVGADAAQEEGGSVCLDAGGPTRKGIFADPTRKGIFIAAKASPFSSPIRKRAQSRGTVTMNSTPTLTSFPLTVGRSNGENSAVNDGDELCLRLQNPDDRCSSHSLSLSDAVFEKESLSIEMTASRGFRSDEEGEASSSESDFADLYRRCRIVRDSGWSGMTSRQGYDVETIGIVASALSSRDVPLLCAERVSQMTKTYNDIEAVKRLLEEKERDLELAARIGQTLLSKNKELASRTENLEEQLSWTNDKVCQLRHDLTTKEELLRCYTEDLEEVESNGDSAQGEIGEKSFIHLEVLQKKVQSLEEENMQLKFDCTDLKTATESYEDKEKKLVEDCVKQLAEVNSQVETFSQELQHRAEENSQQKEELNILVSELTERQKKINQMTIDNLDLHEKLTISISSQRGLTKELGGMQDKYDEMFEKLEEMQDEMCLLRGKNKVRASGRHHHTAYTYPTDSLASELETSLQQELSQSSRRAQSWKVFETAKAAKRAIAKASTRHSASSSMRTSGSITSHWDSDTASNVSATASDVDSMNSDGYSADMDSVYESNTPELGRPGIPGSSDLESALRTLALDPSGKRCEANLVSEESSPKKKVNRFDSSSLSIPTGSGRASPSGASISSSLPGCGGGNVASGQGFKMSDKLQIVKPLEGSMTLRHWQQLATPHLGGIFEQRDGVQMKGEKKLDLKEERYSLSDFEEDDDPSETNSLDRGSGSFSHFPEDIEKCTGSYHGLGALLDPRTPSPSLLSLRSSPALSESLISLPTSTPKLASDSPDSTQNPPRRATLGLADLLSSQDNPSVSRALMRVSNLSAQRANKTTSSSSMLNMTGNLVNQSRLLSRSTNSISHGSPSPGVISSVPHLSTKFKSLPGSRSFDEVSTDDLRESRITVSSVPTDVDEESQKHFAPGMTGRGFLQQLKNRGFSLYGLWAGATTTSPSSTDNLGSALASTATGLKIDSSVTDDDGDSSKISADKILPPGSGTGVLGALTNLRRGGML